MISFLTLLGKSLAGIADSGGDALNVINQLAASPVNSQRTILLDSTLDLRRVRWIPDSSVTTESPYALGRGDVVSADAYGYSLAVQPGIPDSWRITANSPLQFDVSCPPAYPGQWDMLLLYGQNGLTPPTPSVLAKILAT